MIQPSDEATRLLLWGVVIHLFADWILQNDWQAQNKSRFIPPRHFFAFMGPAPEGEGPLFLLLHPAAYVHSGLHLLGLLLIFPWYAAVAISITHILIDTRIPLMWWRKFYRQTQAGDVALHVALWGDQVAHITVLAIVALMVGGFR